MEGHWKFLGGGGSILEAKCELNWNFLGEGGGVQNKKTFHWGSMDIFWNCTLRAPISTEIMIHHLCHIIISLFISSTFSGSC